MRLATDICLKFIIFAKTVVVKIKVVNERQ